MDAKELRAEQTLTERSNDGVKFTVQYDRSKCQEVGAGAFKGDAVGARPCAVIGPDRVVPPARDKARAAEPWLPPDPDYRRLTNYPYKMSDQKDPTRNISPRQTFQENMQRIIMPPGYNANKLHDDPTFTSKNNKINVPVEVKYCDVPYNINQVSSDQKQVRNLDHSVSNVNPLPMRGVPHGWPAGGMHVRPLRAYGAQEVLQYPDYTNCMGPRPVLRSHSAAHDEQLYPDAYYHDTNIRFKPYPNMKDRYPQTRYEYIGNYPNPYHPSNPFAHKYELPKTIPPHSYSAYPQLPKYPERVPDPLMDGYQRTFSQQGTYSVPIRNPVIHSPYRPMPGNQIQNKLHPYPPEGQHKPVPNKLPYDQTGKMYLDYDNRTKPLPVPDNYYLNELPRPYHPKSTVVLPNFAPASIHSANAHPCYIKEGMPFKNVEYPYYKNMDPSMINHSLTKLPPQFSPSTLAISPADSNASNETAQTHGTSQEDCGYASQSSVTSSRSIESLNRIPMDPYGRYDYRYGPMIRTSPSTKAGPSSNQGSKSKKDIRQFISSWSEGDDENAENSKREGTKNNSDDKHSFNNKQHEAVNNQEQLYVLGLVNVPSEELSKYEHIQKVSKLPENIKGYNSLELLNQFEEAIESSNITYVKPPTPRAVQMPLKTMNHKHEPVPRALSPLDVEAKISQSVIHKDVGCNFEIKPCSPKMLNVEVATPMQTLLNERVIEKVTNPHNIKSPIILQNVDENIDNTLISKTMKCNVPNTASSCKMINSQHLSNTSAIDHLKTNYSLQDLESNSGVCLASLPRLDTDIELNFPEVNQQFINANKTDSVITTSFTKDLPALDVDRPVTNNEYDMNYQFSPKAESETDFSKLSKYRKLKRSIPNGNDTTQAKAQATRVDSVIIKNPDNSKSLEEHTNNLNSGNHYRNDFQEFAMNLVSQAKHSKADQQHDVDKILGNSTFPVNMTNKCDEVPINTPCGIIDHSVTLPNKHLSIIGDNHVHAQADDINIQSKDVSNRYLEKAAIDSPMNLSPQARHLIVGDEDIGNSQTSYKPGNQDENYQPTIETTCLTRGPPESLTHTDAQSLNKTDDTLFSAETENLMDAPDIQYDTSGDPITKPDMPGIFSSSILNKLDMENGTDVQQNSDIINRTSDVTITDSREKSNVICEMHSLNGEQQISGKAEGEGVIVDNELVQRDNETTSLRIDKIQDPVSNLHRKSDGSKKYDKRMSKLKRKKRRGEASHRKRSFEKRPGNKDKSHEEEQNLKLLSKNDLEFSTYTETKTSGKGITEEDNKTDINVISKDCINYAQNVTNAHTLGSLAESEVYQKTNENIYSIEDTLQNCAAALKCVIPISRAPVENKTIEILKSEENITVLNNSLIDDGTRYRHDKSEFATQSDLSLDNRVVYNQNPNNQLEGLLQVDHEHKDGSSLQTKESINPEENNTQMQLPSNEFKSEDKDSYSQAFAHVRDETIEGTLRNEQTNYETQDMVMLRDTCQNEKQNIESNLLCTEKKEIENESENQRKYMQNREYLETMQSRNENCYLDIPTVDRENNQPNTGLEYDIKTDVSERITNRQNYPKKFFRPFVSKELFSARFQNLITFNETFDIYSDNEGKKKAENLPTLKAQSCDPPIRNETTCATEETRHITLENNWNSNEENMELDLSLHIKTNIKYDAESDEKCHNKKIEDEMNVTTAERSNMFQCAIDTDNVSNDSNETKDDGNIIDVSEMQLKTYDDTQHTTSGSTLHKSTDNFVSKSSFEEVKCDENLEDHNGIHELHLQLANTVEDEVCETNIILIDETTSVSPENSHEFSRIGTRGLNNYQYSKNQQNDNVRPRFPLKRSLSDSALNAYDDDVDECSEKRSFMLPKKRKMHSDIGKIDGSHLINIIQSSRRNSISTFSNENFSFCILIDDNCIVSEENYEQENVIQIQDTLNHSVKDPAIDEKIASPYPVVDKDEKVLEDSYIAEYDEEKAWVEDVGCEETIETDDIAENIVIGDPVSAKNSDLSDYESDDEDMDILNNEAVIHTSKVKHIYGDNMCRNDAQLVDALYRTPQMDVNKKLMDRESHTHEKGNKYYDSDSLEMLLAEPVDRIPRSPAESNIDGIDLRIAQESTSDSLNKENNNSTCLDVCSSVASNPNNLLKDIAIPFDESIEVTKGLAEAITCDKTQDEILQSCESSLDNVFSYIRKADGSRVNSSSPEVSSTTPEEKNAGILLKISNFKGSRISEVKNFTSDKQKESSSKLEVKDYVIPNYMNDSPLNRPLRTKAAQKYIPPLRESIPDLKVKLALPQQSLLKFQKNKIPKEEPKFSTRNMYSSSNNNNAKLKKEIPKKIKPKFEDVLKNIDEAQFQMHKEKNKKAKKYIPKVVIKKSENGSHYASTSTKESFNPDLTGRKWQPWVFIEKNKFIDDMVLRNKTWAVFSHRRKSFVLSEKFCKYKSISSAKFVISQPKINDFSTGHLKYTIKLKHSY